ETSRSSRASNSTETAEKPRRLGGHLLRPQRAGRQGVQLGADRPKGQVRSPFSLLRPAEAVVRQDVDAAGHREDQMKSIKTLTTRIGKLSFHHDFAKGYPRKETVEKLYDERDFQRACQAYLWGLPA